MKRFAEMQLAKLVCGVILSKQQVLGAVLEKLAALYGPVDFASEGMDFNAFTDYYNEEMGAGLTRHFVSFERLVDRTTLPGIKHATCAIELQCAVQGNRTVNLDPGYLTLGQLFLASTKDNFFRIYLGQGIFAEVTLYYERGGYVDFPWTYRDYQSAAYKNIFLQIRAIYKKQLAVLR
ncbi:MAG: hypothetical protein A2268_14040 [Candidatus Raymondbacteria bacterium RifOxyA12_full_50_37]|uniref:GTP-binding protein n=1 Tax=Candidatus Raymondbacteria bacterium RIFOXYD12_FULL_49_13 TaxID=1817890 RepID=A0A1F7FLH8_UNCRA|nr:MAG: hypothetical protein A2268_14040 [Candidatus Raymondbacteria bacterium RifOxyA12_full_50_37]OGJ88268.1 MAG: hypothetical protein A2248_19380 [Candidatus Raymondbacteria bacterium RIFOXYA2_FULL_49_16]OGJ93981.1 MAG: hypothetical protein A2487_08805 [Candidatus Raymondbacteria bacterium RifOxyC12_full_50_8]OGJ95006.1 MAG: hypothetical protein A2350_09600 [Candidatus Raymondbacteria bacterium RifOxyB12_full_50_8]OGK07312.1 MAG: hypothetical protein A2519_14045 [Candidatus Raymondbacteria b